MRGDTLALKFGHRCLVSCHFVIKHAGPAFVGLACTLVIGITLACFTYVLPHVSVPICSSLPHLSIAEQTMFVLAAYSDVQLALRPSTALLWPLSAGEPAFQLHPLLPNRRWQHRGAGLSPCKPSRALWNASWTCPESCAVRQFRASSA